MRNRISFVFTFLGLITAFSVTSATISSFSRTDYTLSAQSTYLLSLDINNDGILDIVSVFRMGLISIYLGNGNGTFQKEKYFSPNTYLSFFLPGDYNKDGIIDFATNGKILLGDGKGGFETHDIDMGAGDFTYGASGDMNGDGYLDLVVGDHLNVLINNGDGSFHNEYSIFPNKSVQAICINDYNSDGLPDLVIVMTGYETKSVYYIPSLRNGIFGEPLKVFGAYGDYEYTYFSSNDFNKDGYIDLLMMLEKSGYNLLFLGDGKGSLNLSWEIDGPTIVKGSEGRNYEYILDIDNDKLEDIIVLTDCVANEPRNGSLSYYPGNGDGTFRILNVIDSHLPRISLSYSIASGDFNNDGLMDFSVGTLDSVETPGLSVYLSNRETVVEETRRTEEISFLYCSPNPFNSSISISYQLIRENLVNVAIYDILGRKVRILLNKRQEPGKHFLFWKGDDYSGNIVSSGLFFCVLTNGSGKVLRANKIMFMK